MPVGDAIAAAVGGSVAGVLLATCLPLVVVFTDAGIYHPHRSLWRRWRNLAASDLAWPERHASLGRELGVWQQARWGTPLFESLLPEDAITGVRARFVEVLQRHLPGAAESLGLQPPAATP
ncbi:MAG: hypothetical protein FJ265_18825 [Planctomycetes bacterium]|nr:hypothetical protein [Planctomycetota bacterium]